MTKDETVGRLITTLIMDINDEQRDNSDISLASKAYLNTIIRELLNIQEIVNMWVSSKDGRNASEHVLSDAEIQYIASNAYQVQAAVLAMHMKCSVSRIYEIWREVKSTSSHSVINSVEGSL